MIDRHSAISQKSIPLSPLWSATLDESAVASAWSPVGGVLAAASASGSVYIFDLPNRLCLREWKGHSFGATKVAWHPQDAVLASAGLDGKARLWRVDDNHALIELACGGDWVEHLAWSPSGKYLATAAGRKLKLWSNAGELVREYPDHSATIAAITWKSDADELVSACYGELKFWSPVEQPPTRTFLWKGSMLSLAWSPDGRYLCHGNQDATVHFWIVKTGRDLQMYGYPIKIRELAWNRHSRFLATGGGSTVTIWDCSGKGPAKTKPTELAYHKSPLTDLAYQRSGPLLASGCSQGLVAIWKPGKQKAPYAAASMESAVTGLVWSTDDKHLAASAENGSLTVYLCP